MVVVTCEDSYNDKGGSSYSFDVMLAAWLIDKPSIVDWLTARMLDSLTVRVTPQQPCIITIEQLVYFCQGWHSTEHSEQYLYNVNTKFT